MFASTMREFAASGAGASIPGRCEARFAACSFSSGILELLIFTSARSRVAAGPSSSSTVLTFAGVAAGMSCFRQAGLQRREEPVGGRSGHAAGGGRLRERGELRLGEREDLLDLAPAQLRGGPLHPIRPVRLHERLDLRPLEVAGEVRQTRDPDVARQRLEPGRTAQLCGEGVDGGSSDVRDEVLEAREVLVERVDERVARGRIRRVLREGLAPGRDGTRRCRGRACGGAPPGGLPRHLSCPAAVETGIIRSGSSSLIPLSRGCATT